MSGQNPSHSRVRVAQLQARRQYEINTISKKNVPAERGRVHGKY
jgi:hypothetical protein